MSARGGGRERGRERLACKQKDRKTTKEEGITSLPCGEVELALAQSSKHVWTTQFPATSRCSVL